MSDHFKRALALIKFSMAAAAILNLSKSHISETVYVSKSTFCMKINVKIPSVSKC